MWYVYFPHVICLFLFVQFKGGNIKIIFSCDVKKVILPSESEGYETNMYMQSLQIWLGSDVSAITQPLSSRKRYIHTPDTLGTLLDIAANARPLGAWLKCRTITTYARESVADLSRNCKGIRARESVYARVTESRSQGTGVGRDIRLSP